MLKEVKSLDSHIESLSNSCTTNVGNISISKCNPVKSTSVNITNPEPVNGIRYRRKDCPALTNSELDNFCYYDINCKLICPNEIDPVNSEIPLENNDSIIDHFSNILNGYRKLINDSDNSSYSYIFLFGIVILFIAFALYLYPKLLKFNKPQLKFDQSAPDV